MNNILITSAGRRVSLVRAFMQELEKIDANSRVFITDSNTELSAAAQVANGVFDICEITDIDYVNHVLKICKENNIRLIIPTLDTELAIFSKNYKRLLSAGIQVVISSEAFVDKTSNKIKTHKLFEELGIVSAEIYSKKNYKIPCFIKPINGSSGVDNYIIKCEDQISKYHLENEKLKFFEYFDHDLYDEYSCDLYFNKNSKLKCVIPRKRIEIRGGEVSKALTERNGLKVLVEKKLSHLKGARGCINVQFFMHKKTKAIKGIEINPRFGGGFPLSYLAGGNYPKWLIEEYIYNKDVDFFDSWEENLLMLRYDDEVLVSNYED